MAEIHCIDNNFNIRVFYCQFFEYGNSLVSRCIVYEYMLILIFSYHQIKLLFHLSIQFRYILFFVVARGYYTYFFHFFLYTKRFSIKKEHMATIGVADIPAQYSSNPDKSISFTTPVFITYINK